MADPKETVVGEWMVKAERDLASAIRLLEGDPPYLDTAVYHCQQAAEKALKGFLAARDQPLRRVHDLVLLIDECTDLDASFGQLAESAEILTPYGTTFRYPGAACEPRMSEALEAIACAKRILDHVERIVARG
ncbi:MAG: HEPN domain-containing protein [Chromatiaceae bacterium]